MEMFLIITVVIALTAAAGTVFGVRRDGRGHLPPEFSDRPWAARELPSDHFADVRFR